MAATVLCLGTLAVDYVMTVPYLPGHDQKVIVTSVKRFAGGLVGNFAYALRRLGTDVGFFGIVGNDADGLYVVEDLRRVGVDTQGILNANIATAANYVLVDNTGEKAVVICPAERHVLNKMRIPSEAFQGVSWLHTHLFLVDPVESALRDAGAHGVTTSMDLEAAEWIEAGKDAAVRILQYVDILFVNRETADLMVGPPVSDSVDDLIARAERLLDFGPEIVVNTLGALGACVVTRQGAQYFPAIVVQVIDTTGAGDAFAAAFCHEYLRTRSVYEAGEYASAAGALAVTKLGARSAYPDDDGIRVFLSSLTGGNI